MTRRLLSSVLVSAAAPALLGACSLLYNPSNLPAPASEAGPPIDSQPIDAEIILDTDPAALSVTGVYPAVLPEGVGTGGGAPAILIVQGTQMVAGATVQITATDGTTDITNLISVDNANLKVSDDGYYVAVPVTVKVDPLHATDKLELSVALTQPNGGGGMVMKPVPKTGAAHVLDVQYLPELTEADSAAVAAGTHEYSQVNVNGDITAATGAAPLVIISHSDVHVTGKISASAPGGTAGGPGGGNGGVGAVAGLPGTPATNGTGPSPGRIPGGGGGYKTAGGGATGGAAVGTDPIPTLTAPNGSGGGAGGALGGLGATGNTGGGGGGSVEVIAAGSIMVATIDAHGAAAGTANGGGAGGGGSGGIVMLRSPKDVTVSGAIDVAGGAGAGGAGGDGRVRVDTASAAAPAGAYRGPVISAYTQVSTNNRPTFTVTGQPSAPFSYYFVDSNTQISDIVSKNVGGNGTAMVTLPGDKQGLTIGINHVCLLIEGVTDTRAPIESQNCVDITYMHDIHNTP